MKNYKDYLSTPSSHEISNIEASHFFDFHKFRKSKERGTKEDSFIYQFTQTAMFSNFIENRQFGKSEIDEEIIFFDNSLKEKRTKKNPTIIQKPQYGRIVNADTPQDFGIDPKQKFEYKYFPALDPQYFIGSRPLQNYVEEIVILKHKVTAKQIEEMNKNEWAMYLTESIYVVWIELLSYSLTKYIAHSPKLIQYAKQTIQFVLKKLKSMKESE
jgi:hypothetical protein